MHSSRWVRAARSAFAAALLPLVLGACGGPPSVTATGERTVEIVSHEVSEGETLASIADDYYGDREAASFLAEVNGVPADADLAAGSVLDVPAGAADLARYGRRTEAKVHYNRGTMLAERGDLKKAEEEFKTALRIDPRFADAGYNLGVVLLMSGEASRSVAVLEQVVRVRRDDPAVLFALAKAYLDSGRAGDAAATLEQVLALDPSNEDALYLRGLALLEDDRTDDAVFHLDAYLRSHPNGVWAEQARRTLKDIADGD